MRLDFVTRRRFDSAARVLGTDPTGRFLAVGGGRQLTVLDSVGLQEPWQTVPREHDSCPEPTPDGRAVVFARPDGLARVHADGRRHALALPTMTPDEEPPPRHHALSRDGTALWRVSKADTSGSIVELFDARTLYRLDMRHHPVSGAHIEVTATAEATGVAVCCNEEGRHISLTFFRESGGRIVRHPQGVGRNDHDDPLWYRGHLMGGGPPRFVTLDDFAIAGVWRWPECEPIRFYSLSALGGAEAALDCRVHGDQLLVVTGDRASGRPAAMLICDEDGRTCQMRHRIPVSEGRRPRGELPRIWPGGIVTARAPKDGEIVVSRLVGGDEVATASARTAQVSARP